MVNDLGPVNVQAATGPVSLENFHQYFALTSFSRTIKTSRWPGASVPGKIHSNRIPKGGAMNFFKEKSGWEQKKIVENNPPPNDRKGKAAPFKEK